MHFALDDVAARFNHLKPAQMKPAQILHGFMRPLDGRLDRVLDGLGGSAGEFDGFIDGIFHKIFETVQTLALVQTPRP
jgi:hypothetical protein